MAKTDRLRNGRWREAATPLFFAGLIGASSAEITSGSNHLLLMASGVVIATTMFIVRVRVRLLYGFVEVIFALLVLWDASGKGRQNGIQSNEFSLAILQTVGAIYVLIRGLDNAVQGLPSGLRQHFETRIKRLRL